MVSEKDGSHDLTLDVTTVIVLSIIIVNSAFMLN
jgi:hypothetical protein